MVGKINIFVLLLAAAPAWAFDQPSMNAVDQYILERKRATSTAAPVVNQLVTQAETKLDALEKKLFPLIIIAERRSADFISQQASNERRIKELKEQANFNPYNDPEWKRAAQKDLVQLCCEIKADPNRQAQIQNRVAQGMPALIPPGPRRSGPGPQGQGNNMPPQGGMQGGGPRGNFNQQLGNRRRFPQGPGQAPGVRPQNRRGQIPQGGSN